MFSHEGCCLLRNVTTIFKTLPHFASYLQSPDYLNGVATLSMRQRQTRVQPGQSAFNSKVSTMRSTSTTTYIFGFLAFAVFITKVILNYLSGQGIGPFPRSNSNVSDIFYLEITPAGWAFSIWGLIYTLNGGYIIHALTTLFKDFPAVFTTSFFIAYILSDLFNIAWLFSFSYEKIGLSCGAIIAYQLALYAVLTVVYRNYNLHKKEIETRYIKDAWAIRILAQNGKFASLYARYSNVCIHDPLMIEGDVACCKFS